MKTPNLVKICGLTRSADANFAVSGGADALGFISYDKSPRFIPPEMVRKILSELGGRSGFRKVGVFVNAGIKMVDDYLQAGLDTLQLHGDESAEFALECAELISPSTATRPEIWKAFSPTSRDDVEKYRAFPADKFLLDAFKKGMRGGTGTVMDLDLAKFAVDILPKPVILAGGISPENVEEIVERVAPFGIDVNSGVEKAPGVKDEELIRRLFALTRNSNRHHVNNTKKA
jgi:phosphoribosylanthranilate isomerase